MTIKDIINMSEFSEPYELMLIGRFVLLDLYFNLLNQKKTKWFKMVVNVNVFWSVNEQMSE